ncbi:MAG: hypothetical protein WCD76_14275, partial [Pyrinomonadaceae bacterium]
MKIRPAFISPTLLALLLVFSCLSESQAQRRRTRPSRRVTNPVRRQAEVPAPTPDSTSSADPTLLSTADEGERDDLQTRRTSTARTRRGAATSEPETDPEKAQLRRTVNTLSTQVTRLSDDLTQMRADQRAMVDLERLTRAEQRAENLRSQLREVTDKEFNLQERASQLQDEMEPDAIQQRAATIGSLNASAVRDQIERSLEREKARVQKQLEMLAQSRSRLEAAVASADTEVEQLRQRVNNPAQPQTGAATTTGTSANPVGTDGAATTTAN